MPNPTQGSVHVNRPLTEISIANVQEDNSFIADQVFPTVPVKQKSNLYFLYDQGDLMRLEDTERAPGTESKGGGFRLSTATYTCKRHSWHKDIDEETRENMDDPLDGDRDATIYVTGVLRRKRDQIWANAFFTTGVWTGDQTGVAGAPGANQFQQFDQSASTPITVFRAYKTAIHTRTGFMPNTLVMGREVLDKIADHASIVDRLKYTMKATGKLVEEVLAEILGVERLLVGDAIKNTANENATKTMARIFGKSALLCYSAKNPGLMQPSGGYIFSWAKFDRVKKGGAAMKKIRIEEKEVDRIEGDMYYDPKLVSADCGIFLATAVA